MTAVSDTESGSNLVRQDCLHWEWAGKSRYNEDHAPTVCCKYTGGGKRSNKVLSPVGQRIAKVGIVLVNNLARTTILDTAYIDKNIAEISRKNGALKPTGSSSVATEEIKSNDAYFAINVETKHVHHENEHTEYLCTAARSTVMPPMSDTCLYARSIAQSVQLTTLHESLIKNRQAVVVQGIVEVVPIKPFLIKMAGSSDQLMLISKKMKVAICLEPPALWIEPRDLVLQTHATIP